MNRTNFETKQTSTWLRCQYETDTDIELTFEDDAEAFEDDADTRLAAGRVSEDGWTIP